MYKCQWSWHGLNGLHVTNETDLQRCFNLLSKGAFMQYSWVKTMGVNKTSLMLHFFVRSVILWCD